MIEAQSPHVCPSKTTAPFIVVYAKLEGGRGRSNFANRVSAFMDAGYEPHGHTEYYVEDNVIWGLQSMINKNIAEERRVKYQAGTLTEDANDEGQD